MKAQLTCAEAIQEIPFYCYGEISSELEEPLEAHLAECEDCTAELKRHRVMLELLDERPASSADASLLSECRMDLRHVLVAEKQEAASAPWSLSSWLHQLHGISQWQIPLRIPVGALALVALGWLGARYTPERLGGISAASMGGEPMFSSVRSVAPDASGQVQIAVDDVRRRIVSGSAQDPRIRLLLMAAVKEESNPGVRVESIGILKNGADSWDVRQALLDAVTHDPNAGVRLKALEGLKAYTGDPNVRRTLAAVMLKDDNPGVRVQAIDLLTSRRDDALVGVLQQIVEKDDNPYVKERCRALLQEMKASVGTY